MNRLQGLLYTLYVITKKLAPDYKTLGDLLVTETYDALFRSTKQVHFQLDVISEKALKLPKAKRTTHDHCIPRFHVMKILYTIMNNRKGKSISFKEFVKIVHYLSFQIIVTADENKQLRKNYPYHLFSEVTNAKEVKDIGREIILKVYTSNKIKLRQKSNTDNIIDESNISHIFSRYDNVHLPKLLDKLKM